MFNWQWMGWNRATERACIFKTTQQKNKQKQRMK